MKDKLTELLANLLLGERLPLHVHDIGGAMIVPCYRKIIKSHCRLMAQCLIQYDDIGIDPSPIRNRVLEIYHKACAERDRA